MLGWLRRILSPPRDVYGLDHAVLNVRLPPQTMWMNMGYWEHTADFPQACEALLDQVLSAGLLAEDRSDSHGVRIVDVGCGCGDQSLYLMELMKSDGDDSRDVHMPSSLRARGKNHRSSPERPLIDSYVGITLEPAQAALAQQRIQDAQQRDIDLKQKTKAEIFCADAADPSTWPTHLHQSLPSSQNEKAQTETTWLLALDTMYHFQPSRLPLLKHAHESLHASLMAFDLILADSVSWRDHLFLRLVCWFTGSPFGNFISRAEYERLLVAARYDAGSIEIRDVSKHVFAGLAAFLDARVKEGKPFGMKMGKFRAARAVFGWWARSGVVRGVVVVARRH
ncbi:hypothetical protein N7474_008632 [Penicillium riverlandense]|uniref:uncharacterized protein n=1 Tax=Penicillium riverlandense TaxID=1903569 RepID=UPI002547E3C8|nr:uncharacterized protein N7474_008632 [Penicillium riverlandense]KAJ5812331.1 hypothetical protein N7474_008632 [Penicillium riverlandense]